MNYLESADDDLANFQGVLAGYQATISPPGTFSDRTIFILIAAAVTIGAIALIK
jgi:hypothetical protein